ncbi:hypothetical protein KAR02_00205 [Candidatus Bipolaricaulota bacterium]|nr:hypothetical protein [Candidatus Bipolaricaulota bacterium]
MTHKPIDADAVIEAVFVPNPKLPCTELYNMNQTKVYKVETPEPLVVRVVIAAQGSGALQLEILEAIDDDVTARILHCETRQIGDVPAAIQIQTYLPGVPLDCYPSIDAAHAIAGATHTLHNRLCAVSDEFRSMGIPTLGEISEGLLAIVDECPMKEAARQLFGNTRYQELVANETQYLTYGDPWPQNFLFDSLAGNLKVSIADVDPVIFGPKILPPAMLFSAYFVISFLQHASTSVKVLNLDELIGYWPEPINRQDVLLMMQVYPILLTLQKKMMFCGTSQDDLATHQANLALLARCLEAVRQLE